MRIGHTVGKVAAWLAVIVTLALAALVIFIVTFDWNRARPWIDDKVSDAIGRQFAINGDLRIDWRRPVSEQGWRAWVPWPRFSAHDVTIANPDWARTKHFAALDMISFEVEALPLMARRIVIPAIDLVNPSVDLERIKDGRVNWTLKLKRPAQPGRWTLDLRQVAFAQGHLGYYDQQKQFDLSAVVDTLGQPIPFDAVVKQQQALAQHESARAVGPAGQKKLAAQARSGPAQSVVPASGAEAASRASAAASQAVAAASHAAATTSRTTIAPAASGPSMASSAPAVAASGAAASATTSASTGASTGTTSAASAGVGTYTIGWTVKGTYRKGAVAGTGKIGNVLELQGAQHPFPVQADLRFGDTHLALVGTLTDPAHLAAVDLRLWLAGTSMAKLYDVTGITLPETAPYATDGRLVGQFRASGNVFKYEHFTGRVGGSDINGSLVYVSREPRPLLSGTLVSRLLQFSDLAPLIGADTNASKARRGAAVAQPANKALPVEAFRTDRWKKIDADVRLTGRRIVKTASLPITDLSTHVVLHDGVLTLNPLNFGVAGGTLASNIHLDGSGMPLKGRFSLQARHLKLKQLFPTFPVMQTALGEVNGDAALSATGNSPAALAATSNGEVKTLVTDGTVSLLLMEAAGLNVANVVYEKLFGTRDVRINCGVADFVVTNGVLDSRVFALDTEDAVIGMDGNVNLRDETMNLTIHPHTKGFRVISLRSPLYVTGSFKQPHVGVKAGALIARGGAAIGLGLLNPLASLLALLQPGRSRSLPCGQMLADMEQRPTAPPPGVRQGKKAVPAYMNAPLAASAASAPAGAEPGHSTRGNRSSSHDR
ncbi:cell envelope biogenesis protein AsmA [Burkholderia cepacia]|uniref:AsmA family protein n=1 Tax=Burkholderia cepacia TaxID=292 RepID=UPI000758944F|nr:AsmA family protein [Burkholderia cepacia]KVA54934.1 cell envelope biogenesis protein AsmA [Burkholderia cepacia]KVA56010.1 cell envelope biogenesis protein AsmA [Burkholderia cepacia]KVA79309.1 cell envelope biogenesis protein AsmA [Burkholderia cepacia]KVA83295.1 cell envelope biogenesis protein AsmA [Burkholderia cepacia]KVA91706.1 cell envelope biogenesis protein AsmA [Burkholderia cepacia]